MSPLAESRCGFPIRVGDPTAYLFPGPVLEKTGPGPSTIAPVLSLDAGDPILGSLDGSTRWGAALLKVVDANLSRNYELHKRDRAAEDIDMSVLPWMGLGDPSTE